MQDQIKVSVQGMCLYELLFIWANYGKQYGAPQTATTSDIREEDVVNLWMDGRLEKRCSSCSVRAMITVHE